MKSAFQWQLRGSLLAFGVLLASQAVLLGVGINAVLAAYSNAQLQEIEDLAREILIDPGPATEQNIQHSGPLFVFSADKALVYSNRGRARSLDPDLYRPVLLDGSTVGYFYAEEVRFLASVPNRLFLISLGILMTGSMVLSFGIASIFAVRSSRRIASSVGTLQIDLRELVSLRPVPQRDLAILELRDMSHRLGEVSTLLASQEENKRQWMANLAHDLRTPISGLRGQLEAMRDGVFEATAERIDRTLREVSRMEEMVESMKELQVLESVADIQMEDVDLTTVFADLAATFEIQLRERQMTFDISRVSGTISGDRNLLSRAVGNVVANAVRYAGAGTAVKAESVVGPEECVIRISDDGPGVATEDLPRLFNRFFRGDSSRSTAGAGLGLNISREIVQRHGGQIHAENLVPHGISVVISIPAGR